jgi:YD repeat-containing protein
LLRPASKEASPAWVTAATDGPEGFTVGFGWDTPGPRIEHDSPAGQRSEVDPLADLRAICEAIIDGGLVEEIRRRLWDGPDVGGASRWELSMPNGRTLRGSHGWMLPRMPWTSTLVHRYQPYR